MKVNKQGIADAAARINHEIGGYVYAIGMLRPFLPTLDLQKEFEAAKQALKLNKDDYYAVFSHTQRVGDNEVMEIQPYLYIAERACWVFSINNVDTYVITPRYKNELDSLVAALNSHGSDKQVLVGSLGAISDPTACGGLSLRTVACDNVLTVNGDRVSLPFDVQPKSNDGLSAANRAINYLLSTYTDFPKTEPLKALYYQAYSNAVGRNLIEVIVSCVEQGVEVFYSCGVDVTDAYPFIDFPLRNYTPSNP